MVKSHTQRDGDDSRIGQTVESYSLISLLGTGATSSVYLAQRLDDKGMLVAVKVLSYHTATQESDRAAFRARFLREARAVSKLRNKHILRVLSYGDSDDLTYMIMPVVVGGTLASRLARQHGPLPLQDITDYLDQLAEALDYAHGKGVIHRDVKPSNILVDDHGRLYLTDFGIARLFDNGEHLLTVEGTLTGTGQMIGTPYYMAPEQITGASVGPAADVYATGVVLYQLVTGQAPFTGDTPLAVAVQHLQETPSSPQLLREELPGPAADVILRALAKDPAARYQSVGALATDFSQALASQSAVAQPLAMGETNSLAATKGATAPSQRSETADDLETVSTGLYDELIGASIGEYQIEHLRRADAHSARFVARREGMSAPFQLRIVVPSPDLSPEEQDAFRGEVSKRIQRLAALEHPHIEKIVDSGIHLGMPYVVTPAGSGQSALDLVTANGAMDAAVIRHYLDQVCDAVDYAHAHGVLHLDITAECLVIHEGSDLVLTDFALDPGSGFGSPEQLLGRPVGPYTDVYALGNALYQMLTAHQVFDGKTRNEVVQQHLHSTIPPVRSWRTGLPAGIENVVARAMATEPEHRFKSAKQLAAAYSNVFTHARDTQSTATAQPDIGAHGLVTLSAASAAPQREEHADREPTVSAAGPELSDRPATSPLDSLLATISTRPAFTRRLRTDVVFLVGIVGIVAITITLLNALRPGATPHVASAPTGPSAEVHFFDGKNGVGATDALSVDGNKLAPLPQGFSYDAWLVDDQGEHFLFLGSLVDTGQGWTVRYDGSSTSSGVGRNLLAYGDKVEVTEEQGVVAAPIGKVVLSGAFPPAAFTHVRHLLVAFPVTPGHRGFLEGLLQQTTVLDEQSQVLLSFIQRGYDISATCAAQSVVDIIEGASGAHYRPLGPDCAARNLTQEGDDFGILGANGYLAEVSDHTSLAANSPDATPFIRLHSQHIIIAVTDVKGWLATLDQDALRVLAGSYSLANAQQLATLADNALHGVAANGNESVQPVMGEAGVITAYTHGQYMATLTLSAVK